MKVCHAWFGDPLLSHAFDIFFLCRESDPQKGEEKTDLKSAWFLRTLLKKPEPNLRPAATRKEELEVSNRGDPRKIATRKKV